MRQRLRIAMVAACPFPAARGTPIRIYRMAEALGRRGHEVDVVAYHLGEGSETTSFRLHRIAHVPTYGRRSPGPTYQKLLLLDPLLALKLTQLVRHRHHDLIHAHHVEGVLAARFAHWRFRIPLVFDVHTLLESELPFYRLGLPGSVLKRIGRLFDRRLPTRPDHVVAVSDEIRSKLTNEHGIPAEKVSVIPNGVERELFTGSPRRAGLAPAGPVLVYAGNFAPYQRIDLLLRALARARQRRPDLRLRIVSDSGFGAYEGLAAALGVRAHIEIVQAPFNQLPHLLGGADIGLNPRTACDGLPQKLINYMAAGLPIVSFAGSARYLIHEGSALIVADGDVDAYADAILQLLDDSALARRLGTTGRDFVRELSWSRAAESAEEVYARLLCKPARAS